MGDFNIRPDDKNFRAFYEGHDLFNLIKDKTCFKGTLSPSNFLWPYKIHLTSSLNNVRTSVEVSVHLTRF